MNASTPRNTRESRGDPAQHTRITRRGRQLALIAVNPMTYGPRDRN